MNPIDTVLQREFATVIVPTREPLEDCPMRKTRLLMAQDGLYIETRQPWGHYRKLLWESPRHLPYGTLEEVDTFSAALRESHQIIFQDLIDEAAKLADQKKEWAGFIVWSETEGFHYLPLELTVLTGIKAKYVIPQLQEGTYLVCDVHSHHKMRPFFSDEDNADDQSRVKIACVIGKYDPSEETPFTAVFRYCIQGFFFNPFEEVI